MCKSFSKSKNPVNVELSEKRIHYQMDTTPFTVFSAQRDYNIQTLPMIRDITRFFAEVKENRNPDGRFYGRESRAWGFSRMVN